MRKLRMWLGSALIMIFSIAFSVIAHAGKVSGQHEEIYVQSLEECTKFDTCDLSKIIFRGQDMWSPKKNVDDFEMRYTKIYASYVTSSMETIEKYVFVQFIRGCMFASEMLPTGEVVTRFDLVRRHMGTPDGRVLFRHPDWVIDSDDVDPVMTSNILGRFYRLEWDKNPEVWKADRYGILYGHEHPTYPQVYVTYSPPAAVGYADGHAENSSLEYRTCLYRASDVPGVISGSNLNFATPIKCFGWSQSFVFGHETNKWERPVGIVGICN